MITPPPHRSATASQPVVREAVSTASRPPEQVPMIPTLPLLVGCSLSQSMAAARSATTPSSGAPPSERTLAATSSGVPWPKRQYRSGQITV